MYYMFISIIMHAYMHPFINNFFHQISKDLDKSLVNIVDIDLVRMNIKKSNFKKS